MRAIAAAYGPRGRSVIFHSPPAPPEFVFDGVGIARHFQTTSSVERQACKILYEALFDFDRDYGDGSSSLALIIYEIMVKSHALLEAGLSAVQLTEGLCNAESLVESMLQDNNEPFDDERHSIPICLTAASDDLEVAKKIDSFSRSLGRDGHISVKEGYGTETRGTIYPGMTYLRGLYLQN